MSTFPVASFFRALQGNLAIFQPSDLALENALAFVFIF